MKAGRPSSEEEVKRGIHRISKKTLEKFLPRKNHRKRIKKKVIGDNPEFIRTSI
jgi:hypothetical protein